MFTQNIVITVAMSQSTWEWIVGKHWFVIRRSYII